MVGFFKIKAFVNAVGGDGGTLRGLRYTTVLGVGWFEHAGGEPLYSIELQGHVGETFGIEGILTISMHESELPGDCPCTVSAEILYFTSPSMFSDVYQDQEATVTFSAFEQVDEETFRVAGTFSATMTFIKDATTEPDPDQALELSGSFEIGQLMHETAGE